jgi:hypothetical protein
VGVTANVRTFMASIANSVALPPAAKYNRHRSRSRSVVRLPKLTCGSSSVRHFAHSET